MRIVLLTAHTYICLVNLTAVPFNMKSYYSYGELYLCLAEMDV